MSSRPYWPYWPYCPRDTRHCMIFFGKIKCINCFTNFTHAPFICLIDSCTPKTYLYDSTKRIFVWKHEKEKKGIPRHRSNWSLSPAVWQTLQWSQYKTDANTLAHIFANITEYTTMIPVQRMQILLLIFLKIPFRIYLQISICENICKGFWNYLKCWESTVITLQVQ